MVSSAHASRRPMPMGYYIQEAELIVIADTSWDEGGRRNIVLNVHEVLKGNSEIKGERLILPMVKIYSTADARVPVEAKDIAIVLAEDWKNIDRWPVLEVYQDSLDIQALSTLINIYSIPQERQRLLAIQKIFPEGNPAVQKQFFTDLRDMENPDNFQIMIDWYDTIDPSAQKKLVELIGNIADMRGVPTLIKALLSPHKEVYTAAAHKLYYNFSGAPGVEEAFEKVLHKEGVNGYASKYLSKRSNDPKFELQNKPKKTRSQRAGKLMDSGKIQEAKALYSDIVEDQNMEEYEKQDIKDYVRVEAVKKIIDDATDEEKKRIREAMLPLLRRYSAEDNYLHLLDAAKILRALNHSDCLEPLLDILKGTSPITQDSAMIATMAIRELDSKSRQKAAKYIVGMLKVAPRGTWPGGNHLRYIIELIWISAWDDFKEAEDATYPNQKNYWEQVRSLLSINKSENEGDFLLNLLRQPSALSDREVRNWVFFRLGDLKYERAIPELVRYFVEEGQEYFLTKVFINMGGEKVEEEMVKLLTHPDHNRVRRQAVEVLSRLQKARCLPLLRRMIKEDDFGLKFSAIAEIGHVGEPEDIDLLQPFTDYWKADRTTHYHAVSAVAEIRNRYDYDMNGPIEKKLVEKKDTINK
jgi:HEAT repeat protein